MLKESGTIWTAPHGNFKDYTLGFYDDVDEMIEDILNEEACGDAEALPDDRLPA